MLSDNKTTKKTLNAIECEYFFLFVGDFSSKQLSKYNIHSINSLTF